MPVQALIRHTTAVLGKTGGKTMRYILTILSLFTALSVNAQSVCCAPPDSCTLNMIGNAMTGKIAHVVISGGQSNSLGRTDTNGYHLPPVKDMPYDFRKEFSRVYVGDNYGNFFKLKMGSTDFTVNANNAFTSWRIAFAIQWEAEHPNPNDILFFADFSRDGNPISNFIKGGYTYSTVYLNRLQHYKNWWASHDFKVIKYEALVWSQGESDYTMSSTNYLSAFSGIITDGTNDGYWAPETKIIISGIPTYSTLWGAGVEAAFQTYVSANPNRAMYLPNNAPNLLGSDVLHYNVYGDVRRGFNIYSLLYKGDTVKNIFDYKDISTPVITSDGNVSIKGVQLPKYKPYDSVVDFAATIKITRVNGQNVFSLQNDGDATFYNLKDSLYFNGGYLCIPYKANNIARVISAHGSNSLTTSHVAATSSGSPYQLAMNGCLPPTVTMFNDRLQISWARLMEMQLMIWYDSVSNTFYKAQLLPNPVNLQSSYQPVITYGTQYGVLYIQVSTEGLFKGTKIPKPNKAVLDLTDSPYELIVNPNVVELNRFIIQDRYGNILTSSIPPHKMCWLMEWGTAVGDIDLLTYYFGSNASFSITGKIKLTN